MHVLMKPTDTTDQPLLTLTPSAIQTGDPFNGFFPRISSLQPGLWHLLLFGRLHTPGVRTVLYIYISIHACVYTGFTFACRSSLLRRRRYTRGVYASSLAREYNGRRRRRPPPTEKVALGRGGTPFEFTRHADHARPSAQSMRGLYDPGYIFHSPSIVFNTLFVGS